MAANPYVIQQEARRLDGLSSAVARAQLGDRIARTFQLTGSAFAEGLDFNARLATELRRQAEASRRRTIWDAV